MRPCKRATATLSIVLAGIAGSAGTAQAMTSGTPADGNGHPATVAMLVSDGYWARPFCSGILLSGKVVLSASHCMSPAQAWQADGWEILVSNDPTLQQYSDGWLLVSSLTTQRTVSQIVLNPAYDPKLMNGYVHDVSAAVLASPLAVDPAALPTLPPVGILDQLRADKSLRSATFTVLGYGRQEKSLPANTSPTYPITGERRVGSLGFDALDKDFIHQSQRISKGQDGACFGDSGGPSLLQVGQTNFVVGVTSSGDMACFATNTATRTDTKDASDLLTEVLANNPDGGGCIVASCLKP